MLSRTSILLMALALVAIVMQAGDARAVGTVSTVAASDHLAIVPIGGLRNSGVTLSTAIGTSDTTLTVSNALPFLEGQAIELSSSEVMTVQSASGDGPGFGADTLTVLRAQHGTLAAAHNAGISIFAEFSRFDVRADALGSLNTGATLTSSLDTQTFDLTPAILKTAINNSATLLFVSDASRIQSGGPIRIDGEQMQVLTARRGFLNDSGLASNVSGARLQFAIGTSETVINITDKTPLIVGERVQVDAEQMLLNAVAGDGPGGAQDTMTVTRAYNGSTAASHFANANVLFKLMELDADADNAQTVLDISNSDYLEVGNVARVDNEEMLIVGFTGDGFAGVQDQMTVIRGYNGTLALPHLTGAFVLSGKERITVSRGEAGTTAASHSALAPISAVGRIASVSSDTPTTVGSTLLIDSERLNVLEREPSALQSAGVSLSEAVGSSASLVPLNSVGDLEITDTVAVDTERMAVSEVTPSCTVAPGMVITPALGTSETVIEVNDVTLLTFTGSCSLKIDSEEMLATTIAGDGPGGGPDEITVERGWHDTTAASHSSGATIVAGRSALRVFRGLHGTTPASHSSGAAVSVIGALDNAIRVSRGISGTTIANHNSGAQIWDVDGLAAYLFTTANLAPSTGVTLTQSMNTSATVVGITDNDALGVGWIIVVDNEKMKVTALAGDGAGGAPDNMTIARAQSGTVAANHVSGASIRGRVKVEFSNAGNASLLTSTGRIISSDACDSPVKGAESITYSCATEGSSPLGPGPDSNQSGVLATVDIVPRLLEANTPQSTMTLTGSLVDVTGESLGASFLNGNVKVVKCPDVNGDRTANFPGDVVAIARAALGQIPQLPVHDITNDGNVNFPGDAITAAKIVTTGQPSSLRCVPN